MCCSLCWDFHIVSGSGVSACIFCTDKRKLSASVEKGLGEGCCTQIKWQQGYWVLLKTVKNIKLFISSIVHLC